ncbi:MAG TPA: hypothetical protein VF457_16655, partial [Burkholderiaceae bacterium]
RRLLAQLAGTPPVGPGLGVLDAVRGQARRWAPVLARPGGLRRDIHGLGGRTPESHGMPDSVEKAHALVGRVVSAHPPSIA